MTAVVPRPATRDDIDYIRGLVSAGVVGSWHYRWPALKAIAHELGLTPQNAVWQAQHGHWSKPNHQPETPAQAIREATTR